MQKLIAIIMVTLTVSTALYAGDKKGEDHMGGLGLAGSDLVLRELSDILADRDAQTVGELQIADIRELLAESSVRMQEIAYIQKTRSVSWAWPGAGHFMNDDPGRGAFFTATNVVLMTGTVLGVYFLLPDELQFDNLNYFDDSFGEIEDAWKGQSFKDYAPSLGVLIGGIGARVLLGHFAAESAARLAEEGIESSRVTFEPFGASREFGLQATWWM